MDEVIEGIGLDSRVFETRLHEVDLMRRNRFSERAAINSTRELPRSRPLQGIPLHPTALHSARSNVEDLSPGTAVRVDLGRIDQVGRDRVLIDVAHEEPAIAQALYWP